MNLHLLLLVILLQAPCINPCFAQRAETYDDAEVLFKNRNYDEAREKFLRIADRQDSTTQAVTARFRAARCLFEKGDLEAFKREGAELLGRYPQADNYSISVTRLMFGKITYKNKKWQEAADELGAVADSNPRSICAAQALALQGDALRRLKKYDEARAAFFRTAEVKHNPQLLLESKHRAAQCLFAKNDFDAFMAETDTLLAENPSTTNHWVQTTLFHRAHVPGKQGRFEESADRLMDFIAEHPKFRQKDLTYHRSGAFYFKAWNQYAHTKQPEKAAGCRQKGKAVLDALRQKLETDIARNPEKAAALNVRAMLLHCYEYQHDFKGVAQAAKKLSEEFQPPSKQWAMGKLWYAIGNCNTVPPDFDAAKAALDEVIAANVEDDNLTDHIPTKALAWRAFIARVHGDATQLTSIQAKLATMPENSAKTETLSTFEISDEF